MLIATALTFSSDFSIFFFICSNLCDCLLILILHFGFGSSGCVSSCSCINIWKLNNIESLLPALHATWFSHLFSFSEFFCVINSFLEQQVPSIYYINFWKIY